MLIVGLCGGSGSGKSTVASMFRSYGISSLDADALYHELVSYRSACVEELCAVFGEDIVKDGALDRKALSRIVFSDAEDAEAARLTLNRITHAHVLKKAVACMADMERAGSPAVLFDAPLLFESGFHTSCDLVICVVADTEVRIARLIARDGITEAQARARIQAQLTDEELMARADRVIRGDAELCEIQAQVDRLAREILEIEKNKI